jgi:hypothetical protein
MMDFDRKDFIMQRIAQNAMQFQQSMMMGMGMPGMMGGMAPMGGAMPTPAAPVGEEPKAESSITANARQRVAESGSPT